VPTNLQLPPVRDGIANRFRVDGRTDNGDKQPLAEPHGSEVSG
jgi:hypothetical protein